MKTYALKIRGGAAVDKNGKKAGKGPLVAEDISHTIGTAQDQYIFQPAVAYAAGFAPEESAKTRGIGFQEEKAPTLRAGVVPGVIILDDQGCQQISIYENGIVPTLRAQTHRNPPNVVYCMDTFHARVGIDKAGALMARDYKDPPIIIRTENADRAQNGGVYIMDMAAIEQGKNALFPGAIYKGEIAPTLTARGPGGVCIPKKMGVKK